MATLPVETMQEIFRLAATDDLETTFALCLVDASTRKFVSPFLKHITLADTSQIDQFVDLFYNSPELSDLIEGFTLLHHRTNRLERMEYSLKCRKTWEQLFNIIENLPQFSTLVLSRDACEFLEYEVYVAGHIDHRHSLVPSNFRIKHLIISHSNTATFLEEMNIEELSWYGCEWQAILIGTFGGDRLLSKSLKKVNIYIADMMSMVEEDDDEYRSRGYHGRNWTSGLIMEIITLRGSQMTSPDCKVYLHCGTQDKLMQLNDGLRDVIGDTARVGKWGNVSDMNQETAVFKDLARKGFLQRESSAFQFVLTSFSDEDIWCDCFTDAREEELEDEEIEDFEVSFE